MATTTAQRYDRLVPNATCKLTEINEHLLCALCSGYLIDATTIIECLHTFCRSCIVRYLESSETCPVCDVPLHQTNPLLGIRSDTTLQTLIYKLVPGVFKDEVKRRCVVINNAHTDGKPPSIMDRLLKDICDMTTGGTIYSGDEKFSVCLQYLPSSEGQMSSRGGGGGDARRSCGKKMEKSPDAAARRTFEKKLTENCYLLCPASITVAHLKKLIRTKLELSSDYTLDLFNCSPDEVLDDRFSLADVAYVTAWTSVKPLHFLYRINHKSNKSVMPAAVEASLSKAEEALTSKSGKQGSSCSKRVLQVAKPLKTKAKAAGPSKSKEMQLKNEGQRTNKVKGPPGKCLLTSSSKARAFENRNLISKKKSSIHRKPVEVAKVTGKSSSSKREEDVTAENDSCSAVEILTVDTILANNSPRPAETEPGSVKSPVDLTESVEVEVCEEANPTKETPTIQPPTKLSSNCRQKPSPPSLTDCAQSADSALSPSRPETANQSAQKVDSSETVSDAEGNVIDSASDHHPPSKKKTKMESSSDRNLFAAINSMIVNNDNVVSSSTSSQVSADDGSDTNGNKTSVETQTNVKLISRRMKKGKLRSTKKDTIIKSRKVRLQRK